jgi:hypothetical protein
MASTSDGFVTMKDGTVLPVPVLQRLWAIEARGLAFRLDDGDDLVVSPGRLLDDSDRAFLREHKATIITILSMEVTV